MGLRGRWRFGVVVSSLVAAAAIADGRLGTSDWPPAERVARMGPGPQADRPEALFRVNTTGEPLTVSEVQFYVDQVHDAGVIELRLGAYSAYTAAASPGWHAWPILPPITLAPYTSTDLRLIPLGSTEVTLRHLGGGNTNPWSLGWWPEPLWLQELGTDAGTIVSFTMGLDGRRDRLALAGCPTDQAYGVVGNPYVRSWTRPLTVPRTQRYAWLTPSGVQLAAAALSGYVPCTPPVACTTRVQVTFADGGVAHDEPWSQNLVDPVIPFFTEWTDAGVSNWVDVTMSAEPDGGVASWLVFDTGAVALDPCAAPVRASFGGHQARALDLPPGADYSFRLGTYWAQAYWRDADGDGFGAPTDVQYLGRAIPGWAPATKGPDCDDTRADRAPLTPERCDGVDNDCNDIVDDALTDLPACELQQGVCTGARKPASRCVDGGWTPCDGAEYGPDFQEERCDAVDSDCDGRLDDLPTLCPNQLGVCAGLTETCVNASGFSMCDPTRLAGYEPVELTCDGLDNDCNGAVDDLQARCPRYLGVCAAQAITCLPDGGLTCAPAALEAFEPLESRCDGLDNDCDGLVDGADPDVPDRGCPLQKGVCAGATFARTDCSAAPAPTRCDAERYGPTYEERETTVDGLDNDCDGRVDEVNPATEPTTSCGCASAWDATLLAALLLGLRRLSPASRRARRG